MAPIFASKEPSSDDMAYENIIWTLPSLLAFNCYLSCHGWSAGDGEQLRQTLFIYI